MWWLWKSGRRAEPTKGKNMKVRTRAILVIAMIAALLATAAPGAAAQTTDDNPARAEDPAVAERDVIPYESQNMTSLRASLKFPEVSQERLRTESAKNASVEEYGEPFLDSELTEIETRVSLLDESDKVRELTAKYERYGGMYLDHATGQLVINLASSDSKHC